MVDVDEHVIEEVVHEGRAMDREDLFAIVERNYDDRPGVPETAVEAYASALDERRDYGFDAEGFLSLVEAERTDEETWVGPDPFYEVGENRLSQYPAAWHDRLGGSTDAAAYVDFIEDEVAEFAGHRDRDGRNRGVAKDVLVDAIRTVGQTDRETATEAIERARAEGELVEDVDQHPDAGVYTADEGEPGAER